MPQIDPDEVDYDEIVALLGKLPMTWYPGLLLEMVEQGYAHNVYQPGGASLMVARLEERIGQSRGADLGEENENNDEENTDRGSDE